ncbi:WASH complex subunit 3-like [Oxyura jamaicensis]|uniref:WASH complex subunit 3-like n=1 Tax=Oxyura jamaicensis TaxID=8884 RepID=UPI0015A579AA|nr:WASH complex subunit 3-like [Oxyura jamaicensis]
MPPSPAAHTRTDELPAPDPAPLPADAPPLPPRPRRAPPGPAAPSGRAEEEEDEEEGGGGGKIKSGTDHRNCQQPCQKSTNTTPPKKELELPTTDPRNEQVD